MHRTAQQFSAWSGLDRQERMAGGHRSGWDGGGLDGRGEDRQEWQGLDGDGAHRQAAERQECTGAEREGVHGPALAGSGRSASAGRGKES